MPKKKTEKKATKKAAKKPVKKTAEKKEKPIGKVTHFYGKIKVAVLKMTKPIKVGKEVRITGATTNFKQTIASAEIDHKKVKIIPKGKQAGVKVNKKVREGDEIFAA